MASLFRLNLDILVRTLCLISSFAVFVNFSSLLGTAMLVANSILLRLVGLAAYLIDGAAFASESLAGILRGRRDPDSLHRLFRLSLGAGLGFAVLFLAIFFLAERPVLAMLTSHEDLIATSVRFAPWLVPVLLLGSLAYIYDGLFLGLTEGRTLRNSMLLCTLGIFLPAAFAAIRLDNNDLLWASMTLFMGARTSTLWLASRKLLAAEARSASSF
jgi:MATE family multidrug resistance protein